MRVSLIHVRALLDAVADRGTAVGPLLAEVGLTSTSIGEAYGWVDEEVFDRLMRSAVEHTADPAFGLTWGEHSSMMRYDVFAMLGGAHAPTLRQTLECVLRLHPVLGERPEGALVDTGGAVALRVTPFGTSPIGQRLRAEFATAGISRWIRYLCGGRTGAVVSVRFAYPRPIHAEAYRRVFGDKAQFSRPHTALELDRRWLDRPLPNCNAELHSAIAAQAGQVLARVMGGQTHAARVRSSLAASFPDLPDMRGAAKRLGISERSLRRRLAEEGTSFSQLAREARCVVAQRLLRDHTMSVQQVAFEAGFDSATAFHRAFKRWTGQSPLAFRTGRGAGQPALVALRG
jgi:AraC-like DNA-binding protein